MQRPAGAPRQCWVRARPEGTAPAARCSHTATLVGGRYLFIIGGGYAGSGGAFRHLSCVHRLDMRTLRWERSLDVGASFPARRGHSASLHEASQRVVVFGGTAGGVSEAGSLNDLWLLHVADVDQVRWESGAAAAGAWPRPRRGHGAEILPCAERGDVMLVFGGYLAPDPTELGGAAFGAIRTHADYFAWLYGPDTLMHVLRLSGQLRWEGVELRGSPLRALALSAYCLLNGAAVAVFGGTELVDDAAADGSGVTDIATTARLWTFGVEMPGGSMGLQAGGDTPSPSLKLYLSIPSNYIYI